MTWSSTVALFTSLVVLAAIPSLSVLTVVSRSATLGFAHGAWVSLGIVTGDVVFILLALGGLSLLTSLMGTVAVLLKYGAGLYLIVLGIRLAKTVLPTRPFTPELPATHQRTPTPPQHPPATSRWSSYWLGLSITLADQKATLFYLGFLPAFINPQAITGRDISLLLGTTIVAVGGIKLLYAGLAHGLRLGEYHSLQGILTAIASLVMVTVGVVLILRS